jgi:hypothetical protein
MPPIPANTPESVVDKENAIHKIDNVLVGKPVPRTEPRNPLRSRDLNTVTPPDQLPAHLKSISAPAAAPKPSPLQIVSVDREGCTEEVECGERRMKRMRVELANERPAKRPAHSDWKYGSERADVELLINKLSLEISLENVTSPVELFRSLEREGKLGPDVLKTFAKCSDVQILMMGPTYGGHVNELGLLEEGKFPAVNCTVPLFHGFTGLRVLDLTCVPIQDEDIRYMIKLSQLQALGLSGTGITSRGLRYITKHAQFLTSLQCIKLCYVDKLDDVGISELVAFPNLAEVDVFGSNKITLKAIYSIITGDPRKSMLKKVRLTEKIHSQLRDQHVAYSQLGELVANPAAVNNLSEHEVRLQLRKHQKYYPNIFLNLSVDSLHEKLCEIVTLRRKEEFLWSICQ